MHKTRDSPCNFGKIFTSARVPVAPPPVAHPAVLAPAPAPLPAAALPQPATSKLNRNIYLNNLLCLPQELSMETDCRCPNAPTSTLTSPGTISSLMMMMSRGLTPDQPERARPAVGWRRTAPSGHTRRASPETRGQGEYFASFVQKIGF